MASAVVNNVCVSPEGFLDCPPAFGWLSPRMSFSRDLSDDSKNPEKPPSGPESSDLEASPKDLADFEFLLHDPVAMLPADELFSDGKLVPLQLASSRPSPSAAEVLPPESATTTPRRTEIAVSEAYVLSPKAPRCSSRWRELLGLKKLQSPKPELEKRSSSPPTKNPNPNPRSLKRLLNRNLRSSAMDPSMSLPLLRDSDSESVSLSSSRLSLSSSSSSGPDHDELPRLSLDSEKPGHAPISLNRNPPRVRVSKPKPNPTPAARSGRSATRRTESAAPPPSADSPRMNASGRVVFQGLERSSSSPGSFNGGPKVKLRGMERSYSANVVRVSPVLNVPVCSLRGSYSRSASVFGFGHLFSKDRDGSATRNPPAAVFKKA
ncbi:hypothetical protein J5N97_009014 [Dioscorea zingiberensis]|uniref:Uncharacterized protein n=1 Tax=Dioscorea zingiberensis TaxID=325984 RepID=A0A9D5CXI1_9LILI|nr:hypothetical protein J5N97_009014 [Dioscorea zingiberensis]